jgi:hypothetical protein
VATDGQTTHKLIHVDDEANELFDLAVDPRELIDIRQQQPHLAADLDVRLRRIAAAAADQHDSQGATAGAGIEENATLQQRLRGLGYLD